MAMTYNLSTTDDKSAYWASVFRRLGVEKEGVRLDDFLDDPWLYLRKIGSCSLAADIDLLTLHPARGNA